MPQERENRVCVDWKSSQSGCCRSPALFNLYREYLIKKALTRVEDFTIGERISNNVRFAEDMAIIAKTQELQGMMKQSVDTGSKAWKSINNDVMGISRIN